MSTSARDDQHDYAEVERSRHDAAKLSSLRLSSTTLDRYKRPRLDALYPLEYVFAQTAYLWDALPGIARPRARLRKRRQPRAAEGAGVVG